MDNSRNDDRPLNVLVVNSSGRTQESTTRRLVADLVEALEIRHGRLDVRERDLARGIAHVDDRWIDANFTPAELRTTGQRAALAASDALVEELEAADIVVIGAPVYNFGVPAALKAWVDMIVRARLTFRYTDAGPECLLGGREAYLVVASGGVPIGSAADFATPFLRHVLAFVGIDDVRIVSAEGTNVRGDDAIDDARAQIADLVHTAPLATSRVA